MFFPVPVDVSNQRARQFPPLPNCTLIAVNVLIFGCGFSWSWGVGKGSSPLSIFTYSFVHADVWHLLGNMWILWVFGNSVNTRIGNRYYIISYFGISMTLGLFAWLFSHGVLIGSSGAIFGVIAMASMLLSGTTLRIYYVAVLPITLLIALFKRPLHWLQWLVRWDEFNMLTMWAFVIVPIMELWGLWRWSLGGQLNWTHLGHLAGFLLGIVAVLWLPTRVSIGHTATHVSG